MLIQIDAAKVLEKKGLAKKTGQPYLIREQAAYACIVERDGSPLKYPVPCSIPLDDEQAPYPPGDYTVADASFVVGDFGSLRIGRLRLSPAKQGGGK